LTQWISIADGTVKGVGAAVNAAVVIGALVALVWPHLAAVFADYGSARWHATSTGRSDSRSTLTHQSAIRHLCVLGLVVGLFCGSTLGFLVRYDRFSGVVVVAAVTIHSVFAVVVIIKSMRRSTAASHWLREHGLTSYEIGIVEKARALSVLTHVGMYICWAVALVVPLELLAGHDSGSVLPAMLFGAALISPLVLSGEKLDRRLRLADQLQLHLKAACHPESATEPLTVRLRRIPDLSPDDLWQLGLPRERAALIAASPLLQRLLRRNIRRYRGLDQATTLDAAQLIFDDLAALAASREPITSNPVITRVIRLALLGDMTMLDKRWAKPHRVSDHRSWNPWSLRRVVTVTTGTVSLAAATAGSLIAVIKAFTS
jgi:hypothetical protein